MLDTLITNGRVADGTGNPVQRVDVAVDDGKIVEVGRLSGANAERVIDATGSIVCPGFVDPHSHSDRTIHVNPTAQSTIRQGVTTEIVGNCGMTLAPVSERSEELVKGALELFAYDGEVVWRSFGEYLDFIDETGGTSQNLGWLVGHNTLRDAAGVGKEPPTEEQLDQMERWLHEAMEVGALGMSTGLEFRPGSWSQTDEVIRLNRVVGQHDGIYASHVRNRDRYLQESTEEFLRIVREGGTRGEFSHMNVRHNTGAAPGAWERAVETLAQARDDGLEVLADTTPFLDGLGRMSGILPSWLLERPPSEVHEMLGDPEVRDRLREDCDRYWRFIHKGEWHRVRLLGHPTRQELNGRDFTEIAEILGVDEWDAFFDVLYEAGEDYEERFMAGRLFTEEHLAQMVSHPLLSLGVDTWTSSTESPLAELVFHPLAYCGHVHYLTHHVREKGTLRLEEAIRKMTSMPAAQFGLLDRGLIREGSAADIVVFDYERLDDVATLEDPVRYPEGVEHVLVNGVPVVTDGEHTGERPGRQLTSQL